MKYSHILAVMMLLGMCQDNMTTVNAIEIEEVEEQAPQEASEETPKEPEAPRQKAKPKKKKLAPEQIAKLKAEKKAKREKMQSCLTIARAYYQANKNKIEAYIQNHKAVTNPAAAG